jgi:hypothetical protein
MRAFPSPLVIPFLCVLGAAGVISGACSSSNDDTFSPPSSAQPIAEVGGAYGSCDTVNGFAYASETICGFACSGGVYYILCDGSTYTYCDCSDPGSDFTLIPNPGDGLTGVADDNDAGSPEASAGDAASDGPQCIAYGDTCTSAADCCVYSLGDAVTCGQRSGSSTSQCYGSVGATCTKNADCSTDQCGSDGTCSVSGTGGDCINLYDCNMAIDNVNCIDGTCQQVDLDAGYPDADASDTDAAPITRDSGKTEAGSHPG